MKLRIAILVFALISISMGDVYGADWKLYSSNDESVDFYDAQSIAHPSTNIVRVWQKRIFTEKDVARWVAKLGPSFKNLSFSMSLKEINCIEKKWHTLSLTAYDNEGGVINSSSSSTEWGFIIPETIAESLYKEVCK
jgi:hypothetical protein